MRLIPFTIHGRVRRARLVMVATMVGAGVACTTAELSSPLLPAPPPPPSSLATECTAPRRGWIWCDDFEQDRLSSYFEVSDAGGRFMRATGVGAAGSTGMRGVYTTAAQTGSGSLKLAFGRTPLAYFRAAAAPTRDFREVYWRVYVRHQTGWQGGGGDKLSRAMILAGSNWQQAMIAHIWSGGSSPADQYLVMDPASGTDASGRLISTTYNDAANLRWLAGSRGTTALFAPAAHGSWYCVEAHVRLNEAGQANGVFEFWVDGTTQARRSDLNWVGTYSAYGINAIFLENYWNAGSTVVQERVLDNFVVSEERIGC